MRTLFILLVCIIFSTAGYCQLRNSTLRLSVNCPVIPSVTSTRVQTNISVTSGVFFQTSASVIRETYDAKPGVDMNFNFDAYSSPKFFVTTGVTAQLYNYKRNIEDVTASVLGGVFGTPSINTSITIGQSDPKIGRTTSLYVQVPVTIGKVFVQDKLRVQAGLAPSVLLLGSAVVTVFDSTDQSYSVVKDKSGDGFNNLMLNGVFETSYFVTPAIALSFNYQRSFTPIYKSDNSPGGQSFFNTFSFGATYRLVQVAGS